MESNSLKLTASSPLKNGWDPIPFLLGHLKGQFSSEMISFREGLDKFGTILKSSIVAFPAPPPKKNNAD